MFRIRDINCLRYWDLRRIALQIHLFAIFNEYFIECVDINISCKRDSLFRNILYICFQTRLLEIFICRPGRFFTIEAIKILQDMSLHQTQASAVARRLNTATNLKYCGVILKCLTRAFGSLYKLIIIFPKISRVIWVSATKGFLSP